MSRMNDPGKPERETQRRVIKLFRNELNYRFLADWTDRDGNSNIEGKLLTDGIRLVPRSSTEGSS